VNAMSHMRFALKLLLALGCAPAVAYESGPKSWKWLLQISGDLHYSMSDADIVPNVNYTQQFALGGVGSVAIGRMIGKYIYLGGRYEYWYAQRDISGSGGTEKNRFEYQTAAVEAGYRGGNARAYWLLTAGLAYPVQLAVSSSSGIPYLTSEKPWGYEGRITVGLRLNSFFNVLFTAGYRFANLGILSNAAFGSLVPNDGDFNMSGPFGGVGIGLTF